ncbi:hypothetical protein BACUNI_00616 [Bacteroides uniformis ATCC 8492]|uniref:Uncharacterized protein n=1 Tax=Bacteroides uniformis (strain ATCC 8492 / DSM 6597 / CCUG 4942 / CIP 103695 / JCM 5828 / KCTC 5204 / NCTC 13054 / VPI 0061) TaxID=411479 RepID=A0ABC9NGJ9_BACUC|nr:hypothetical protein BACUNI_00616 [Bacteroides uniformis ATCC 8492]
MKINFIPPVPLASTWVPLNATPARIHCITTACIYFRPALQLMQVT